MIIRIIGSAAGGGFPQVNCACRNCAAARRGEPGFQPRTQSSLAVSADGSSWFLLNASPDIRQQIAATPELWPAPHGPVRSSPIRAVVLTNGDVDHVAGLLSLREGIAFALYASRRVQAALSASPIFRVLDERSVARMELGLDTPVELPGGLTLEAFAAPGKVALYLEDPAAGDDFGTRDGDTLGLRLSSRGSRATAIYLPGCAAIDARLSSRLDGSDLLLLDGTLYTDDEMIRQGLSQKTGRRMGHISMSGTDGSIAALSGLRIGRRVFVHINNSNPVLRDDSAERRAVEGAGWEIAHDGMEIRL